MPSKTVTVRESGGDYSSLAAAIAGEKAANPDLVAMGGNLTISIEGTWSAEEVWSDQVALAGWTTDATHKLLIYATGDARHTGTWTSTAHRIRADGGTGLLLQNSYVEVSGLQLRTETELIIPRGRLVLIANVLGSLVDGFILKGRTGTFARDYSAVELNGVGMEPYQCVRNCIIYGIRSAVGYKGVGIYDYFADLYGDRGAHAYLYNNTVVDCDVGYISYGPQASVRNCLAQDCGDGFVTIGTPTADYEYNCSDISGDAPGTNPVTGDVAFVDAGSGDYHLSATDTVAKGAGTSLSADADFPFVTDVDGGPRTSPWDIGADALPIVMRTLTYSTNGATEGLAPVDPAAPYANNSTVTVLGNSGDLCRRDYKWTCWNTAADGSGTDYDPAETFQITADTVLYAKWSAVTKKTVIVREIGTADYRSLALAVAGELAANPDLTDTGIASNLDIRIEGAWIYPEIRSSTITLSGFTTDADHRIYVEAVGEARHLGRWTPTAYRLVAAVACAWLLAIDNEYVHVSGIQAHRPENPAPSYGGTPAWPMHYVIRRGRIVLDSCIAIGPGTITAFIYCAGFLVYEAGVPSPTGPVIIRNCLADGFRYADASPYYYSYYMGFWVPSEPVDDVHLLNCTAVACSRGFDVVFVSESSNIVRNCLAQDCGDGFSLSYNSHLQADHNCTDLADDLYDEDDVVGDVTFADADAHDYHLSATDIVARGRGADLSGGAYPFAADMDGGGRSAPWDVGADDYAEPPTGTAEYGLARAVVDALLPRGSAWRIRPGGHLDHLLSGIADFLQAVIATLARLSGTRKAMETPYLPELEREYGVAPNSILGETARRMLLQRTITAGGCGDLDSLQEDIDFLGLGAGSAYDLVVAANDPAVDPATFITAGGFCIVGSYAPVTSAPASGWPLVFFVAKASGITMDGNGAITAMTLTEMPEALVHLLIGRVLKRKPLHAWALLMIDPV